MSSTPFLSAKASPDLYPLNELREEHSLHFGVRSIANQWKDVLSSKPLLRVHPRLLPTLEACNVVLGLGHGERWMLQGEILAQHGESPHGEDAAWATVDTHVENPMLVDVGALFERAGEGLLADLGRLQTAWRLRTLREEERDAWRSVGVVVFGPMERIHVGPGAVLRDVTLNTEGGPVVIGPDAEIMEGCRIRGPFALGEGSAVRMGSTVYGPTTVGRGCKVGGELSNVVIHDWSNKAHGGFLGNSVLGSWSNLGAETTCSNLKNTYGDIAEWNEASQSFQTRGRIFCGLIMGDHSKSAIHTAFSTATVVGSFCNVFGPSTPPRHIPHFSWGHDNNTPHAIEGALSTARKVMARRGCTLSQREEDEIRALYDRVVLARP
ncbi:MAG: glucose-1-phosphate thymidylyltransferase [Bacteroidetes bacterium]|nr:glucose-1-phosphate thymidylyltransferase [Bacteroidota bacterium]MDA0902822.1 glucose-1-phosphate thymidylyltransferase [Bacteroidota bacterium]MDA1242025.1 glucose-1-phosphate thymidylyltransferase [Bacteroidota bacterium]